MDERKPTIYIFRERLFAFLPSYYIHKMVFLAMLKKIIEMLRFLQDFVFFSQSLHPTFLKKAN